MYNIGFVGSLEAPSSRPSLEVICREFRKGDDLPITKSWISGGRKIDLELPMWAIPPKQIRMVDNSLTSLLVNNFGKLLEELKNDQDEIVSATLGEAARHAASVSECST